MNNIGAADLKLLKELYPNNYDAMLEKIKNNYPIQYLIGYVDFLNLKIIVNENVLIPRFETELVVSEAIKLLKNKKYNSLLDVGTGSGAIAIALKKNLDLEVDACDISVEALNTAKLNALNNNVDVNFFKLDILNEELTKKYDCIISNPPYVRNDEYTSLETKFEPQIALFADDNGLIFYKNILKQAKNYLNENGCIIFEIGASQCEEIKRIALNYFNNAKISILKDYNNLDRGIFIEL